MYSIGTGSVLPSMNPELAAPNPARRGDAPFLAAAAGRPARHTPVWFMRQAGRSLPEYRAIRGEGSILDAIKRPELAAEITLQPVHRYGVDAAVLYSDISDFLMRRAPVPSMLQLLIFVLVCAVWVRRDDLRPGKAIAISRSPVAECSAAW